MSNAPLQPFRFLDLPSELRNNIYSLLLEDDTTIKLGANGLVVREFEIKHVKNDPMIRISSTITRKPKVQTSLLLTCRQVNNEATSILYANNNFSFESEEPLHVFIARIGKKNLPRLRHIELEDIGYRPSFRRLLVKLAGAIRLEEFTISGVSQTYKTPEKFVNLILPLMRALQDARKGRKDYKAGGVLDVMTLVMHKRYGGRERQKNEHETFAKEVKALLGGALQ